MTMQSTKITQPTKIAIIGAGIAGLTVAHRLKETLATAEITIFEKARGVSGRTSTRRAEPFHFDHGAPFFTARSDKFKAFIQPMLETEVLTDWQANVVEMSGTELKDNYQWQADRHFVAQPKMNEMAKFLAKGLNDELNVKLGARVGKIEKTADNQWLLTSEDTKGTGVYGEHGDLGIFDWVICTAPAEQSAELVPTNLPFYARINESKTEGCYALMLGFEKPLNMDLDVALIKDSALSCIVVNSQKPNRPDSFTLTILSSNEWAEQHIDHDQEWVKSHLLSVASDTLKHDLSTATHIGMHRWRYANTSRELDQKNQNETPFLLDAQAQFAVAGDWLIKGSVENAFVSADKLADEIIKTLTTINA